VRKIGRIGSLGYSRSDPSGIEGQRQALRELGYFEGQNVYRCSYNHKRGAKACPNRLLIRQERLDQAVLDAIAEVLDERLLELAVEKALQPSGEPRTSRRTAAPLSRPSSRSSRPGCELSWTRSRAATPRIPSAPS
jgi:recombinase-like zinc beta ribbon protein